MHVQYNHDIDKLSGGHALMDDNDDIEVSVISWSAQQPTSVAINQEYAAFHRQEVIEIRKLASGNEDCQFIPLSTSSIYTRPILALSLIRSSLLAISAGSQILVYDISTTTFISGIAGTGRTVTALTWSTHDVHLLAAGCIDGSINLWNVDTPSRPIREIRNARGPCCAVEFHRTNDNLSASINRGVLQLYDLSRCTRGPVHVANSKQCPFNSLSWHLGASRSLLVAASEGELMLYDFPENFVEVKSPKSLSSCEDGEGYIERSSNIPGRLKPISSIELDTAVKQIQWCDGNILLVLAEDGLEATFYEIDEKERRLSKTLSHRLTESADAVSIHYRQGTALLGALNENGIELYELPALVLDTLLASAVSRDTNGESSQVKSSSSHSASKSGVKSDGATNDRPSASMKPIPIRPQRFSAPGFARTSKQLQRRQPPRLSLRRRYDKTANNAESPINEPSTPPQKRSLTSSLELPKPSEEEIGSPMPFLSPTIPSRGFSPNDIPPLDDNNLRPSHSRSPSPGSPIPSTVTEATETQDSDDSDDETFVDAMQGSATFLPGGINVPLPKACGALFAPNGQLLTFFPPKPSTASVHSDQMFTSPESRGRRNQGATMSRLFPTFGNLISESRYADIDSDSESLDSSEAEFGDVSLRTKSVLQLSSFPSQQPWKSRTSPSKPGFNVQQNQHKVIVNIYELNDISSSSTTQRKLAESYRLLRSEGESGADICEHNASVAEAAGIRDAAEIWHLLAMLLDDKVPLEAFSTSSEDDDIMMVAKRSRMLTRSDSGVDLASFTKHVGSRSRLRWADHPFGGAWLVRKSFQWAENRSDTQMLACISAVLAEATRMPDAPNAPMAHSFLAKLPTSSHHYACEPSVRMSQTKSDAREIPTLRTNSLAKSPSVYESPSKVNRASNTSSRNASQPATPYLNSTSSTPPLSLPSLSRQGTRISASGSVSPEYQRSSFSMAAKYYAQSITDKFASYGTSPPTKKLDTSPSAADLSSSLPGGSWGKSVSFATSSTTTNTARGSLLSRSFDYPDDTDAYESDGTVHESERSPHLSRKPVGDISVVPKNQHLFTDEVSGCAEQNLTPEDLAWKGQIWSQYYAEQLRTWGMQAQAAELEKIIGITSDKQISSKTEETFVHLGILPVPLSAQQSNNTCSICFEIVRRMQQVCPSCCHISHLGCLQEYSADVSEEGFTCPTGCGCLCSELAYVIEEPQQLSPRNKPVFKKKASFTDPRRWRARVEGDGW